MAYFSRANKIADIIEALDAKVRSDYADKKTRKRVQRRVLSTRAMLKASLARRLDQLDASVRENVLSEAYALIEQRKSERQRAAEHRRERAALAQAA